MADSPQILTPEQFRRKYGYSAPTQPQTPITLTPEQFTARYGNVLAKPSNGIIGKRGRIKSAEDLAAGFTQPQAEALAPTNIPPSPFIQEIIDRTGVTKALPEEDSTGESFLRGTKQAVGALGEATQILPSLLNLQPKFLRPPQHERVVSEIEAETKKASDDVKAWADKNIQARPATGKYARPAENFLDYLDPVRMYQTVGENAPLMAAFAGATIAHPAAGAALMFAVEGGSANEAMLEYEKKTGKKIPPLYRDNIPVIVGAVNAALEKTGLENIFKVGKAAGLKRKLVKAALATIIEGGTEGAQEVTNILAETGYGGQIPADAGQRLVESIYAGLLLGAGGSTISALTEQPDRPRVASPATTPQSAIPSQPQLAPAAPEPPEGRQTTLTPSPAPAAQFEQPSVEIEDKIRKTTEALRSAQEDDAETSELPTAQATEGAASVRNERPLAEPSSGQAHPSELETSTDAPSADIDIEQVELRNRIAQQVFGQPFDQLPTHRKNRILKELQAAENARLRSEIKKAIKPKESVADEPEVREALKQAAEPSPSPVESVSPVLPAQEQAKTEIVAPAASGEAAQAEKQVAANVQQLPITDIATDVDRFQNRASDFSEKTAATVAERFDPNLFDPIVVWRDPANGKTFVLSGHSRLEGMKRRGEKNVPARYFEGDEQAAMNYAQVQANRLGTAENLSESIKAYRTAKSQNLSRAKLKDLFDGDLDFLEAAQSLDQKGDFVNILNQPAAAEFPYIKRFSRWVGELRGKYADKLTDRHEQQIFDWLYKGEKKNVDTGKDAFFNKVETQVERLDFSPEQPLVMKRGEVAQTGTRGRADTAALERELDQLREDRKKARTTQEAETIDKEIARISKGVAEIVKTQPDLFSVPEETPVVSTQPKTAPVATIPEKPIAPRENILQQAARKITQRGEATAKEYDRSVNIFDSVIAKQKGKPIAEQQQAVRAELESAGVNPVIVEELTNPQRAARPFDEETGARRDLTSREGRIKRAVEPPAQLKSKVDAIANAGKVKADAEASLEQAKGDIINEIESRGGEVVVNTDTGAFTIKLNIGKAKMGLPDMIALGNLRQEAANAGAYSLATVGRGFEIAATPERIAKATPLSGTFGDKVKEFIRRSQAAKSVQKEFAAAKKTAQGDLVDFYLSERAAGREPRSLKAVATDGTAVEVLTRRKSSSAKPDTPVAGRDFAAEIAKRKSEAEKRSDAIGPRGEPFLSTRKAGESAVDKAKQTGSYVAESSSPYIVGRIDGKNSPPFYSQLYTTLDLKLPNSGSVEQMQQAINAFQKKGEFKKDEIEWLGLNEWLAEQKGKATKQQILDFVKENQVGITEVEKGERNVVETGGKRIGEVERLIGRKLGKNEPIGDYYDFDSKAFISKEQLSATENQTKFSQYVLPGGENYRELLLTLPNRVENKLQQKYGTDWKFKATADELNKFRDAGGEHGGFKSSHFDEPNILAHVRFDERTDADGKRVLFVEEIQSDWHQKGRKEGYKDKLPDGFSGKLEDGKFWVYKGETPWGAFDGEKQAIEQLSTGVPAAPFKTSWHELAFKRVLRYAVDNGFDRVAWTTGEQQAERYDLSKQVDRVGGMKGFYDKILPEFVNKYTKKWGGKSETTDIQTNKSAKVYRAASNGRWLIESTDGNIDENKSFSTKEEALRALQHSIVHSLEITPAMREAVSRGQVLFERQKKYEPNYDKRPDASDKTDQLAKEAVESIGVNRRHGRVLLANAISAEAREKGAVNLIGKEVRTSDDVAVLAQVYRDPRWEKLRYIFVKDGKIVFVTGVSSRLPASTVTFPVNEKSSVEWLRDLMFASEADSYYMLHNHPSGEVKPSRADIEETKKISDAVEGFKGHVIIDSNKYTQIARLDGKIESAVHHKDFGEEKLLRPSIFNPVLGTRLTHAEVVAKLGQKYKAPDGWVTLISSGASGVRGMMEVEAAVMQSPKRAAATVRRFARQTGASDVFLVSEQSFWDKHKRELTSAVKDGFLRDAVSNRGYSIQEETMILPSGKEFGISERRGREVREGGNILQKAAQKVQARKGENPQIYTPEFKNWFGDSKVTDDDGKPLIVYHGTAKSFDVFKPTKETGVIGVGSEGGFYFSDSPRTAAMYSGNISGMEGELSTEFRPNSMPVYLKIENPVIVNYGGSLKFQPYDDIFLDAVKRAHDEKRDGVIIENIIEKDKSAGLSTTYIVFDAAQIKSAIGNRGTFSPTEPSIVRENESGYSRQSDLLQSTADELSKAEIAEADEVTKKANDMRQQKIEKSKSEGRYFSDSIAKTSEPEARHDSNVGGSDKAGLMTEQEATQKYNMRECE